MASRLRVAELNISLLSDGRTQFHGTTLGTGNDNADDPANMTDTQKARMLYLRYADAACANLTFAVLSIGADEPTFDASAVQSPRLEP